MSAPQAEPKTKVATIPLPGVDPDRGIDDRPKIRITTLEREVDDAAIRALSREPNVYHRGNGLVTVLREAERPEGSEVNRRQGCPRIAPLAVPRLREMLAEHARWIKSRKTRDGELQLVDAHPPDWAVKAVAARGEWPGLRHLESVVEAPTMRPNGSILEKPGWDANTGLLYEPNAEFPPIPEAPTVQDAKKAAAELLKVVGDFPFSVIREADGRNDGGGANRSVWLAALLTPLARFAIEGTCPLFAFDANTPGTGKSKLADLIAIVATGRDMPRTAYADNDEEMRKRITSIAKAGDRLTLVDNVATTFGGSGLDAALTAATWRDRDLGKLEMTAELPMFTVWYVTGNNLTFKGDIPRRVVICRLESSVERPEERDDFAIKGDLLAYARRERPRLVAAALTILRAHIVAGRPTNNLTPLGSFDAWSSVIREAVCWITGFDPCAARLSMHVNDPEATDRAALVQGWAELPGSNKGVTAAEAVRILKDPKHQGEFSTLRDALLGMSRTNDLPGAKAIGIRLKAIRDRVVAGHVLRSTPYQGTQRWRVEPSVEEGKQIVTERGSSGTGGSDPIPCAKTWSDNCNVYEIEKGWDNTHQSLNSHGAGESKEVDDRYDGPRESGEL